MTSFPDMDGMPCHREVKADHPCSGVVSLSDCLGQGGLTVQAARLKVSDVVVQVSYDPFLMVPFAVSPKGVHVPRAPPVRGFFTKPHSDPSVILTTQRFRL